MAVQANPITTPAIGSSYIRLLVNTGFPRKSYNLSLVIIILSDSPVTIFNATFLNICEINKQQIEVCYICFKIYKLI
jgi:hypothetical protein